MPRGQLRPGLTKSVLAGLVAISTLMISIATGCAASNVPAFFNPSHNDLALSLDASTTMGQFSAPREIDTRTARHLFEQALVRGVSAEISAGLQSLGFELARVNIGDEVLVLIREAEGRRTGKGAYVIRQGTLHHSLLQVPHRQAEHGVEEILVSLMADGTYKAAALNTARKMDGDLTRQISAHYFDAFAAAFAGLYPGGRVIQMHGMDQSSNSTMAGKRAHAVVSSGTSAPNATAINISYCLKTALGPEAALLYPIEVSELGATSNTTGARLRRAGFDNFVHVEFSGDVRWRASRSDPILLRNIGKCLSLS